jgi:membrane fusion protein (multidrug efflux system)
MKTRRFILIFAVIIVIAGGVVYLATRRPGGASAADQPMPPGMGAPSSGPSAEAAAVATTIAAVKMLKPYVDVGGNVEAAVDVAVYPDIGGKLVSYLVGLGESVTKGQAVAKVDPSKPGSKYEVSPVGAPITGTVTSIRAEQGETVTTSSAIATVGIIDDLKIVIRLAERDAAKAFKGMTAAVTLEALPDEIFTAVVSNVSPVLDPTSRTREVALVFTRKDGRISPGMYAKLRLYTTPIARRVVIPASAVVMRNDETFVFIVADRSGSTVAEKRLVTTGASVEGDIVIVEGIAAGDRVVSEGKERLTDGAAVTVVKERKQ